MAEDSYTYFNKNNGDVTTFPRPHARLEALQNWVTVQDAEHLAELQADREGARSGRGNLLGSSNVGDRIEERHQVPAHTPPTPVDTSPPVEPDPPVVDPVVETPTPDPVPEPIPGPDPADRPARSAVRSEWVEWAIKSGASRSDAESMTKSDLIEVYGE